MSRSSTPLGRTEIARALAIRPQVRSEHFVLHHRPNTAELSTASDPAGGLRVDETRRFGQLMPKRHARRAVTRSLLKRQGRAAWQRHAERLRPGDWLLRLRGGFDTQRYTSAASEALRSTVRSELDLLFGRAVQPATR